MLSQSVFILLSSSFVSSFPHVDWQPQQVHLSFGDNPWQIVVTWSTMDYSNSTCVVEYGLKEINLKQFALGATSKFTDGGRAKRSQYIHRVKLEELKPGRKYFYRCGSTDGWSNIFDFMTIKHGQDWSPMVAVYGDMGHENPQSLPRLQQEAQSRLYDCILHIGDFAYDLHEQEGRIGDKFMRQIESIAAYVPYMTSVGNHEEKYNFSHYKSRFSMPGTENSLIYSFNLGPAHFISISTEFYYFLNYGIKQIARQYDWLVKDLTEANSIQNRTIRPWIIVMGHRPMYCSNNDKDDCVNKETRTRVGLPVLHWYALEPLLYSSGVDLALWAHEHSYERLWPVYNRVVLNGSYDQPYVNPRAPVHVTTGSAGNRERKDGFLDEIPPWTAFRNNDYGYSRLHIANKTHLYMEQVSDDQNGQVIDQFWIVKDNPWSYLSKKIL